MKDAQRPDHVSLNNLISRLKEGRFVIPDFQREFEWKPWDIRDLMRSIFLDYYVGSLLLWKGKQESFDALACEAIYGYAGDARPEHIVLDGQQRLTAMYYAFTAPDIPAPGRHNRFLYFIRVDRFMAEEYDEAFEYDWTRRGTNLLADREAQFESHMFPLAMMGEEIWELVNWMRAYEDYWTQKATSSDDDSGADAARLHAVNAKAFAEHIQALTQQYQVAYIELDKELELDKVCDIFTQINSKGIRLDVFDLINALLKPKALQLKHLWREAKQRLYFVETDRMNVYVLQVMSILRQAYCSPKYLYYLLPGQERKIRKPDGSLQREVLVADIKDFERRWHQAVNALERAIDLLRHPQEFGAISSQYLPYVSILPAFAALQEAARALPASRRLDAQRKIRHWYWASVFLNRYSGSVESTSARDYLDVKAWFENDDTEPGMIAEFRTRFRSLELRRETRRGYSVYNGIFNLLVLRGARDWMSGNVPQHGDLDDHHIVPKSWGRVNNVGSSIDSILNRSPLTADTNRKVISDRLPNEYLPELIEANGESEVRTILESHFISPSAQQVLLRDPFGPGDFEEFLDERQRTLQEAIEDLLIKERIDLSPQLRELDADIEAIELELRREVVSSVEGDPQHLPPHVVQRIDQRVQAAVRKNPALNSEDFDALDRRLEYADLREVQDAIASKATWSRFQDRFGNKETLMRRFDQLAELRNGIRHSRTVDDVARKEGEAAVLWFKQLLNMNDQPK